MKRYYFILTAIALLAGCSSDDNINSENISVESITFSAKDYSAGSNLTRSAVSDALSFTWSENDEIGVYPETGYSILFPLDGGQDTKTARFDGGGWALKNNTTYYAYYPYSVDNTKVPYSAIPISYTGQKQSANNSTSHLGAYDYMWAKSKAENGNVKFEFEHAGSIIKLPLTVTKEAVFRKITLSSATPMFITNTTLDISDGSFSNNSTKAKSVTMDLDNIHIGQDEMLNVWIMIAPTTFVDNITATVITTSESEFAKEFNTAGLECLPGHAYQLSGTLDEPSTEIPFITLHADEEQTMTMTKAVTGLQYQIGDGEFANFPTGEAVTFGGENGDLKLRAKNTKGTDGATVRFGKTNLVSCSGDIRTLVDWENHLTVNCKDAVFSSLFKDCKQLTSVPSLFAVGQEYPTKTMKSRCFESMFSGCTSLTSVPEDLLPSTILGIYCYQSMFSGCSQLTNAPVLPAEKMADDCYHSMFYGCSSLESVPLLPATNLSQHCYKNMFSGCTSLTSVPEVLLPAVSMESDCYYGMFQDCTSLKNAPLLPAKSLANYCYDHMFMNCTSLEECPTLEATVMKDYCYSSMFNGCSSIKNAPSLPATFLADACYQCMFENCSSLTDTPELKATILFDYCYSSMFSRTAIAEAPALPATEMKSRCYEGMFSDCKNLTKIPDLPSTSLAKECYMFMFSGCTNLEYVMEELPATELSEGCYNAMFQQCEKLIKAPKLPSTNLADKCYSFMFNLCKNLAEAPVLPAADATKKDCYCYMFQGCKSLSFLKVLATNVEYSYINYMFYTLASSGTLVMADEATWDPKSWAPKLPSGWIIVKESEYEPASTTKGTAKATINGSEVDVNWVQLWENGPKFAECNVGATSATGYGGYYCWGKSVDKDSNGAYNDGSNALSGEDDTATKLWGSAWRMPTQTELQALLDNCDVEWTTVNSVNGRKFTGKADPYKSASVFLPAADRCIIGIVLEHGNNGNYWSSTPKGSGFAYHLGFDSGSQRVSGSTLDYGFSVRAVLAE